MNDKKARIIAFYLPQYHPTPDNDMWWGKGFTEWTNVGKAKPLFRGHYQPRVPADLGYYDLRLSAIREAQAEMAMDAGIEGFCYYHYWFGNGKEELELPFNEVLKTGRPNFPFCLCWANESWHSKFWNKDGSVQKKLLVEQLYPGEDDITDHFYRLLPAFKDPRYIQVDGKPLFMIYRPYDMPDVEKFIEIWNMLARKNGLNGIYFMAQVYMDIDHAVPDLMQKGLDGINIVRLWEAERKKTMTFIYNRLRQKFLKMPRVRSYRETYSLLIGDLEKHNDIYPTIIPNWDHTPRSGSAGYVLTGSTPNLFKRHVKQAIDAVQMKPIEQRLIFLKSWNEWGEGNYMEPDLKFGREYLNALKELMEI